MVRRFLEHMKKDGKNRFKLVKYTRNKSNGFT